MVDVYRAIGPIHSDYRWNLGLTTGTKRTTVPHGEGAAGDISDATYVQTGEYRNVVGSAGGSALTGIETEKKPLTGGVNTVTLKYRASYTTNRVTANRTNSRLLSWITHARLFPGEDPNGGFYEYIFELYAADFAIVPDGAIYEFSHLFTVSDMTAYDPTFTTWSLFEGAVNAPANEGLNIGFGFGFTNSVSQTGVEDVFRIYDAWFEVDTLAVGEPPPTTGMSGTTLVSKGQFT